jgi:hypothetical protein
VVALSARIETLKLKYPRSEKFIESEYERYRADDSQNDESDFFVLLRRDVECRNPPEFQAKGLSKKRATGRQPRR